KVPTSPPGAKLGDSVLSSGSLPGVPRGGMSGSRGTLPPMPSPVPKAAIQGGSTTSKPQGLRTSSLRSASKLEMIPYDPEESLIDHKGRSKPLYKPRTPRPDVWKPSKPVRILLGLFPGTRVMALESAKLGAPYAVFGLLSLLGALFMMIGWTRTEATLR